MHAVSESTAPRTWAGHGLSITVRTRHALQAALLVSGELDLASGPLLRACLENQLDTGRRFGRADLAGVTFIDAAGLSVLLDAHQAFQDQRGMLVLTVLSPQVTRLIRLLGAERVLMISASAEAALEGAALPDQTQAGRALRIVR